MNENKIFVIYVGVAGVRREDIDTYCREIGSLISPQSVEGEIIVIPVQEINTRIECINPTYITSTNLTKKHKALMIELHNHLEHQIKQLKTQKS